MHLYFPPSYQCHSFHFIFLSLKLILRAFVLQQQEPYYGRTRVEISTCQPRALSHTPDPAALPSTASGWRYSGCAAASTCCCSGGSPGGHGVRKAPQIAPERQQNFDLFLFIFFYKEELSEVITNSRTCQLTWKRILLSPLSRSLLCRLTMKAS